MIFLATVFPVPLDEDDDDPNAEIPFDFLMEFWKQISVSCTTLLWQPWYGFGPVVKSRRVLSPFFSLSVSFAPTKDSSWICWSTILPSELGPHLFIRLCRLLVSV